MGPSRWSDEAEADLGWLETVETVKVASARPIMPRVLPSHIVQAIASTAVHRGKPQNRGSCIGEIFRGFSEHSLHSRPRQRPPGVSVTLGVITTETDPRMSRGGAASWGGPRVVRPRLGLELAHAAGAVSARRPFEPPPTRALMIFSTFCCRREIIK
jgi:hypothetical protein